MTISQSATRRHCSLVTAAIVPLFIFSGCSHPSAPPTAPGPASPPATILVALDRSESTAGDMRIQFLNQLDYMISDGISQDIPMDVWAYDHAAVRIYGPSKPQSHNEFDHIKLTELGANVTHPRTNTMPGVLLTALANDHAAHPTRNLYVVILTDGDEDDYNDWSLVDKAAHTLGSDPSFHLAIIDIRPENRKKWDNELSNSMPGRYLLAGQAEGKDALTQFLQGKMSP